MIDFILKFFNCYSFSNDKKCVIFFLSLIDFL